jgi:hypothetical protein
MAEDEETEMIAGRGVGLRWAAWSPTAIKVVWKD